MSSGLFVIQKAILSDAVLERSEVFAIPTHSFVPIYWYRA